jgi:ATP sulfurylase
MLMECLMRMLVDQRILEREAVIEAVEDVIATKTLMVAENEHAEIANVARGVLSTLANSLAARSGNSLFDEPT